MQTKNNNSHYDNVLHMLDFYKDKCKVLELETNYLDELCNFERESKYQLNGSHEEWKKELDQMETEYLKEKSKFDKKYIIN